MPCLKWLLSRWGWIFAKCFGIIRAERRDISARLLVQIMAELKWGLTAAWWEDGDNMRGCARAWILIAFGGVH